MANKYAGTQTEKSREPAFVVGSTERIMYTYYAAK